MPVTTRDVAKEAGASTTLPVLRQGQSTAPVQ